MAKELAEAGFNLNLGPVVDLDLNPDNPVIGARQRSFGADPNTVTTLARAFIAAHRDANIVTVAKHFPGHGSSRVDSHMALADVSETWREIELEPYRRLAKDGLLDAVMIGHLYHPRFSDGAKLPASLSGKAVRALRSKDWIDFHGVVMSDDLEMGAVSDDYSLEERVIKAINAGTDIVIVSNVGVAGHRAWREGPRHHRRCGARRAHLARADRAGLWPDHAAQAPARAEEPRRNDRVSVIRVVLGGVPEHVIGIGGVAEDDRQDRNRAVEHEELLSGAAAACQIVMSGGMI